MLFITLFRRLALLALAAFSIAASSVVAAASTPVNKNILIVGDSISAAYGLSVQSGWVALLSKRVGETSPSYRVVNASISGETTSGGAARLGALLKKHKPAVVVIELGGNDALRGLPIAQTTRYMTQMIKASQSSGARVVLLPMKMPANFGAGYVKQFEAMYPTLAKQYKTGVSDFIFKDLLDNPAFFQADKIHPTAAAQPLMLDAVWPAIAASLK